MSRGGESKLRGWRYRAAPGVGLMLVLLALVAQPAVAQTTTGAPACAESDLFVPPDPSLLGGALPLAARTEGAAGVVALTFDAGADRGYAEDILDTLWEEGVVASFGITGQWARAHPELVTRMAVDGHFVINHTMTHRSFTGLSDRLGGLSAAGRQQELFLADAIIAPLIGRTTCPWFRLPYGDSDRRVNADAMAIGYDQNVGWTVDSAGWRGIPVQDIISRCLRLAAPNAVYVMHVGGASRDGPALRPIIHGLRERGYGFATVAAL